ncbi:MAG: hypothetical protein MJ193_00795 [Clostridia bacterium]|nr:hypothetical protein [Clostridia bacterium]
MLENGQRECKKLPAQFYEKLKNTSFFVRSFSMYNDNCGHLLRPATPHYVGYECGRSFPPPWTSYMALSALTDKDCGGIRKTMYLNVYDFKITIGEFKRLADGESLPTWEIVFDSYAEMCEWLVSNGVKPEKVVDEMELAKAQAERASFAALNQTTPKFDNFKVCLYPGVLDN